MIAVVVIAVVLAFVIGLIWAVTYKPDTTAWQRAAHGETELYRIRRSIEAGELKREIRRDAQALRRETRRELRRFEE